MRSPLFLKPQVERWVDDRCLTNITVCYTCFIAKFSIQDLFAIVGNNNIYDYKYKIIQIKVRLKMILIKNYLGENYPY